MAKISILSTAIAGAIFALALSFGAQAGEFDGVTVNIMTQTGAIQEPLQRRAPEFEKLTGAKINVIAPPERYHASWRGGSLLANLPGFQELLIASAEYNERGPTLVHRRCL